MKLYMTYRGCKKIIESDIRLFLKNKSYIIIKDKSKVFGFEDKIIINETNEKIDNLFNQYPKSLYIINIQSGRIQGIYERYNGNKPKPIEKKQFPNKDALMKRLYNEEIIKKAESYPEEKKHIIYKYIEGIQNKKNQKITIEYLKRIHSKELKLKKKEDIKLLEKSIKLIEENNEYLEILNYLIDEKYTINDLKTILFFYKKKESYSEDVLKEMFENAIKYKTDVLSIFKIRDGLGKFDNEKIVYGSIIDFKKNETNMVIKITLTTKQMIEFDKFVYGKNQILDIVTQVEQLKNFENLDENIKRKEKIMYVNSLLSDFLKTSEVLIDASYADNKKFIEWIIRILKMLSKPYFFESEATIDLSDQKTYERLIERKEGGFYEYKMSSDSDKGDFLIDMVFSASPIKRSSKTLAFNGDELKEIYEQEDTLGYCVNDCVYTEKEKMQIESILNRVISDEINFMNYRINHVGQGLNSYIEINEDKTIFFDIGDTLKCSDPSRNLANVKNLYKTKNPELVILSHWDVDHILGVAECKDDIYNAVWITPDLNYATSQFSLAALRLNYYLSKTTELINVDNSFAKKKVYSGSNIKIYKSSGEDNSNKNKTVDENYCGGYSNKKNNIGLVLELEYNNKKLLSPGDSDYLALAREIKTSTYNYLIVPHHGSRCGRPNFSLANGADLIVPVGENGHGHPIMEKNLSCIEEEFQISLICTNAIGDYQIEFQDDNNN
ncbi:MAG: hypothetical protein N4A40_12325 [Tissierellales bacterium]|nr:hypothetical protein [Tissierellales bacterium]